MSKFDGYGLIYVVLSADLFPNSTDELSTILYLALLCHLNRIITNVEEITGKIFER